MAVIKYGAKCFSIKMDTKFFLDNGYWITIKSIHAEAEEVSFSCSFRGVDSGLQRSEPREKRRVPKRLGRCKREGFLG